MRAVATSGPGDLALYVDLAALREDKVLGAVITKAEASSDANTSELIKRVDRIDAAVAATATGSSAVAVLWGRLSKDPMSVPLVASGATGTFAARPPLASGVVEHTSEGAPPQSLFVVSEGVWVLATGAYRDEVRAHFDKTSQPPAAPRAGSMLHASVGSEFLSNSSAARELGTLHRAVLDVQPSTASVKSELTFTDETGAKNLEGKLAMLVTLATAVANGGGGKCTALEKLRVHVERKASTVTVDIAGIDQAAAAWDPAVCGTRARTPAATLMPASPLPPAPTATAAAPSEAAPAPAPKDKTRKKLPRRRPRKAVEKK